MTRPMSRDQERSAMNLALIFDSVRVTPPGKSGVARVEGCEWPDQHAPRIVAAFAVERDGTVRQVRS